VINLHQGTIAVVEPGRDQRGCHMHVTLPLQAA
jgi:hypothetical protein